MKRFFLFFLSLAVANIMLLVGCSGGKGGELSETAVAARDYLYRGMEFDSQKKIRLAELYYKKAYETLDNDPAQEWTCYAGAGYRYAYMLRERGDMDGAVTVLSDILSKVEETGEIPISQKVEVLLLMASCHAQLKQPEEVRLTVARVTDIMTKAASGNDELNNFLLCANIFYLFMRMDNYEDAGVWLERLEKSYLDQHGEKQDNEEGRGIVALNRVKYLQATGNVAEAAALYGGISDSILVYPRCIESAAEYLLSARRYAEAADMYDRLDTTFAYASADSAQMTFENICSRYAQRYASNRQAGHTAEALGIADKVFNALSSALDLHKKSDAAELAVIYQTHERELALSKARAETRNHRILLVAAVLIILLIAYLLWRSYLNNRVLMAKNRRLIEEIEQREQEKLQAIEQLKAEPVEKLTAQQQLFRRICDLMDTPDHIYTENDVDRSQLAKLLGTNEHYITDAISACADGKSVSAFLNDYRLRYAANLLATTSDSVALIAELAGFARSSFFRVFSEAYGMSPADYRKAASKK